MDISIKAFESICKIDIEELLLDSPILCHGYAGIISILLSMFFETENKVFAEGSKKMLHTLVDFYDEKSEYGYYNITAKDPINDNYTIVKKNDSTFLEGAVGIVLTSLLFTEPIEKDWMRYLLLQ